MKREALAFRCVNTLRLAHTIATRSTAIVPFAIHVIEALDGSYTCLATAFKGILHLFVEFGAACVYAESLK